MVLFAIQVSVFVAVQDPIVQKFAVRFIGGYLSEKTGGDIKVGRLLVSPDLQVTVEDVMVKDLKGNDLLSVKMLRAKIYLEELLEGKIHLDRVILRRAVANMVQYEGEEDFNFQFLADFFSSDKEKEENTNPLMLQVDHISIAYLDFLLWDQNGDDPELTENKAIDYSHLDLDDIQLEVSNLEIMGDSIHAALEMLKAKEMSGFEIKLLQSDVVFCPNGIYLTDLQLETNNSLIHADLNMLYNGFGAFHHFVDSVRFDATIYPTDFMLSDIGAFSPVLYQMPNKVYFQGRFTGPIAHFSVKDMNARIGKSTTFKGDLSMHPLDFNNGEHVLNIKKMNFTYDDIVNFYIPGESGTVPIPKSLSVMKAGTLSLNFKGSYNNFNSRIRLLSDIGNLDVNMARKKHNNGDNVFSGDIKADHFNAGALANASKVVGNLDLEADVSMRFLKGGDMDLDVNGKAYRAQLLGQYIDEVILNGAMKENRFLGMVKIEDNDIDLDFNGLIDFRDKKYPRADFAAVIRHADLSALKLMKNDSISEISTSIEANLTGFDIDVMEGEVHLDSTVFRDSRGVYVMKHFDASLVNDKLMDRRIELNNDFFNFLLAGKINFANLMNALNDFCDNYVHFPNLQHKLEDYHKYKLQNDVEQDFVIELTLKDTKTVSRLLMPNLKIAKNTTVKGTFSSKANLLNLTARSKSVKIGDLHIDNIEFRNFSDSNSNLSSLSVGEVAWVNMTKTDTVSYGLDNLLLTAKMADDTVTTRFRWGNQLEYAPNKGMIEICLYPQEDGSVVSIKEADITVNDSLWQVAPDNFVDIRQDGIALSNLKFGHNKQSIRVDGLVPNKESDTLSVQLRSFDISNFDIVLDRFGFDLDGFITGDAMLSGLKEVPMLLADLSINQLGMDGELIGDVDISSSWDSENNAVDMNVGIRDDERQVLNVAGYYYTARKNDNLDFVIELNDLGLNILTPILSGVVDRMQGNADGLVTVKGSLKKPELDGRIKVTDGGCKVDYLKTFYTFEPTILIDSRAISLDDLVLVDTLGNSAIVEGEITHDHLKDFNLDLKIHPRQFLAMATSAKDNSTFYGTAFANGLVEVRGPFNDIYLGVKARTLKGTKVTIPIGRSSKVKDNDFIVFVQPPVVVEDDEEELVEEEVRKSKNLTLALDLHATEDADLRISLPGIGTIDACGDGNMKIGMSNSTDFSLIGNYEISNGQFALNFRDLMTRNFALKKGGTIAFTGDPTNGRIDATGVYSLKAPLSSLGVQIDSTASSSSNVNVECLIHLKNSLLNPTITFGMNLPNASEETAQTVFSLVDTTNQAVMTSQALSLLVLGTFSYAGNTANNNSTDYLGILASNLLFSALSVNITDNVNVGLRYYSGDAASYGEYKIAMKSEFFDNRMTLETNVGVVTNASNASGIIGEFDLYYKLTKDGGLQAHFYNHSNYNSNFSSFSFDRLAPYTQGLGLSYSRSFDRLGDLFKKKKTILPTTGPILGKTKRKGNP